MAGKVSVKPSQNLSSKILQSPPVPLYDVREVTTCRSCGGSLVTVADFGPVSPVDFPSEPDRKPSVDLVLTRCVECELVQLSNSVDRDRLFRNYWYQSALNATMVASLADIAYNAQLRVNLKPGDTVIDIGCNDGTLLNFFYEQVKVGYDPALNLKPSFDGLFVNDYFPSTEVPYEGKPAKIITAIAMFYDLDNPRDFLSACKQALADDGVLIIQMTDLPSMVILNAFDNICHEHVTYWSLKSFVDACRSVNLHVFDLSYNNVNGGSVRLYIQKGSNYVHKVQQAIDNEAPYITSSAINGFSRRSRSACQTVIKFLIDARLNNLTTDILGASTKGNTFCQVAKIGATEIRSAAEVHPGKVGRYFGNTHIKIVSEAHSLIQPPDYYLVLPWHFLDFFRRRLSRYLYLDNGGLVVPLPEPILITKEGVKRL